MTTPCQVLGFDPKQLLYAFSDRCLAGSQVVVAESYARIFFRNCMSTGELYPVETDLRVCDELKTGAAAVVISLAMLCCLAV
jgi:hypothetical protein